MTKLNTAFMVLVSISVVLLFSSWEGDRCLSKEPVPPEPDYADSTQWFIVDRQGEADLFYVISTETADHLMGDDTCHYADTHDAVQRAQMMREMHAVDSFYSGRLNYYSPYYRQASIESWVTEELALSRLPLPMMDCVNSWNYYLEHFNQGRPFILAGFSQGGMALMEIMKQMPDSVASRMVAAYSIGYKVTSEDTAGCRHLKCAKGATDTGVTICFNSAMDPGCEMKSVSGGNIFCINPVNWRTDSVSALLHTEPSPLLPVDRQQKDTMSVRLDTSTGLLIVEGFTAQDYVLPLIGKEGNYHSREIWLYRDQLRENMALRTATFLNTVTGK